MSNLISNILNVDLSILAKRYEKAEAMCQAGKAQWVEGSIAKALIIYAARKRIPSNEEFSAWCDANNVCANRDERAALVNFGLLEEPSDIGPL